MTYPDAPRNALYWPYKLQVYLLYADHDSIHRLGGPKLLIRTNELATFLGIKSDRLVGYIAKLQELELIDTVDKRHGYTLVTLVLPKVK